jgi:hypothetical protein
VYLGVRTRRHKLLWREYRDPADRFSPEGPALYDFLDDPKETRNLFRPDHPAIAPLLAAAEARLAAIPEIGPDRARRAFRSNAPPEPADA